MLETQKPCAAVKKVPCILKQVERYQVGAKQRTQKLDPDGQNPEHLGRGKDREKTETNRGCWHLSHRVVRHQHHFVVENPHTIAGGIGPALRANDLVWGFRPRGREPAHGPRFRVEG